MSLRFRPLLLVLVALAWLAAPTSALAVIDACDEAEVTYVGAPGGVWNDAASWSGGQVPTATDKVCVGTSMTVNGTPAAEALAIRNGAAVTLDAGSIGGATEVVIRAGSSVTQNVTFTVGSAQTIANYGNWYAGSTDLNSSGGRFVNHGLFERDQALSYTSNANFDNHGTFRAILGPGSYGYTYFNTSGNHTGGTFEVGGTYGNGTTTHPEIQFAGGTHVLGGATLRRTGLTTGRFTQNGALDLTAGNVTLDAPLVKSGTWNIADGFPFAAASAHKHVYWNGGSLSGGADVDLEVPALWNVHQAATVTVPSTIDIINNGTWNAGSNDLNSSGGRFVNNNLFERDQAFSYTSNANFDNHGTFRAILGPGSYGYTYFNTSGNHTDGTFEVGGTYGNGTTTQPEIQFSGGTHVMTDATFARVTGATSGRILNSTSLDLTGGGLRLDAPLANLGTWVVDDTVPFAVDSEYDTINWSGGTLSGSAFVVPAGWTFNQLSTFTVPATLDVINNGTWNAGSNDLNSSGGRFVNNNLFERDQALSYTSNANFDNHGTFRAILGPDSFGYTYFNTSGNHTGGTFEVGGTYGNGTTIFPEIRFSAGTHELTSATLTQAGSSSGRVTDTGANLSIDDGSTLTVNMPIVFDDQLATGAFTLAGTGTATVTAGGSALDGTGEVNVAAGTTLRAAGNIPAGSRDLIIDGTLLLDVAGTMSGTGVIELNGTLRRTGTGTYSITPDVQTVPTSRVEVAGGVLSLATSNGAADTIGDGVWTITNDADLVLSSPTAGIDGAVELSGGGSTISTSANSIASVDGSLTTKNAASVSLVNSSTINGMLFAEGSGALIATDLVLADGALAAGDGALMLGGQTTVASGARLDLSTGTRTIDDLSNDGKVTLLHGDVAIAGSFTQSATGELEVSLDETEGGNLAAADATLDGWLKLNVADMAGAPAYDVVHALLTTTGITTGTFVDFSYVTEDLDAPRELELTYAEDSVSTVVTEQVAPSAVAAATSTTPAVDDMTVAASITLAWPAATDVGSGVAGYEVQLTGRTAAFQTATTATFSSLAAGTYEVTVKAVDHEGNEGATTTYGPFRLTTAPTVGTLTSSTPAVSTSTVGTSVTATWDAAAPTGIAITGYRRAISKTQGETPTGSATNTTTDTFTALTAGTWWVNVVAVDADGNAGAVRSFGPFVLTDPAPVDPTPTDPTPTNPTPPAPTPPAPTPTPDTTPPKVGTVPAPTITPTGIVTIKVPACPAGEASCAGSVKLESKVSPALLKARAKLVNFVLGTAKFTAKGGQTATVKLKLSAKAKQVLKKAKVLKVVTTITVTDAAGNKTVVKKTLTLRAPKKLR